ncbi:uncharacterized protein LOC130988285 [Salvia miltiorrhiza]|uniref:uncharacterized protein LOC130988285 n=1 Tax=Salvia miltiorrhiza TaxID=226208 RepID=UPI0025ACC54D|nr:uncharacterized protein LOC130988285 [Salvia miltiorrhiza]
MLLRSSSTPMLKSWVPQSTPETEFCVQMATKSLPTSCSISFDHHPINKIATNLTQSHLMHHRFLVPLEDGEEDVEEMGCTPAVVGGSGGGVSGGGDGDGDGDEGGCWDSNDTSMDVYYKCMIEADPINSMLLTNYARFLKEIRGDFVKAEVYCGRAILANPSSGNALSLYGDLIWHKYEDANRAHVYFDRAVKAEPDNGYVMASYARFLWDAEDEIEDQQ